MLLKNPGCVQSIKVLRRYVGNVLDWEYTPEETKEFNQNAARLRIHAKEIYDNVKVGSGFTWRFLRPQSIFLFSLPQKLFNMPESVPFFTGFNDLANQLHLETKDLPEEDYLNLTEPPLALKDALFSADWTLASGTTEMEQ